MGVQHLKGGAALRHGSASNGRVMTGRSLTLFHMRLHTPNVEQKNEVSFWDIDSAGFIRATNEEGEKLYQSSSVFIYRKRMWACS